MRTIILVIVSSLALWAPAARAHDVYHQLKGRGGQLCCSGSKEEGDCESVAAYRLTPEGDVVVSSRRYGTDVLVARDRIVWSPVPGSAAPAHWCGVPRARGVRGHQPSPVDPADPDPSYLTICAFIDPGSS
jgi:hypothetical protein